MNERMDVVFGGYIGIADGKIVLEIPAKKILTIELA